MNVKRLFLKISTQNNTYYGHKMCNIKKLVIIIHRMYISVDCYKEMSRIISEKITNGGYKLKDGRYICSLCDVSIIKTDEDIVNSFQDVHAILKKNGINNIDKDKIKITLIDRIQMREYYESHKTDHLQGITFDSRVSPMRLRMAKKKRSKLVKKMNRKNGTKSRSK